MTEMDILSIILIGVGLAMDCFAVATTKGLQESKWNNRTWLMAFLFGLFQGGMPLIGFFAGSFFSDFFSRFAPWIALLLLVCIGGKMIIESLHTTQCEATPTTDFGMVTLLVLALATSIDALATGVIFIPCPEMVWIGISIIALTSFVFTLAGFLIGVYVGQKFRLNVEMLGGIILILIGLKIWIEGLFF